MNHEDRPVEIKDLNKTQLILLALLLSFVTSIATGIVTVTLMQQAPPQVTQTINRVVQNTIEKVVPDYSLTKTQTVIVKEDDLVVDAVSKNRNNFFDVYGGKEDTVPLTEVYSLGTGVFVDATAITEPQKTYYIRSGENRVEAKNIGSSPLGFGILSVGTKDASVFPKASLGADATVKPGQTILLVLSGDIRKSIVLSLTAKDAKDEAGKVVASWHIINLGTPPTTTMLGAPAVNLDGNVLGFAVLQGSGMQILGIDAISKFVGDVLPTKSVAN